MSNWNGSYWLHRPERQVAEFAVIGGMATPAPPLGTHVGGLGLGVLDMCRRINRETESLGLRGVELIVRLTVPMVADSEGNWIPDGEPQLQYLPADNWMTA